MTLSEVDVRALILWADGQSTNLGVRALAQGSSSLLAAAFPNIDIAFQSFGPGDSPVRIGSSRAHVRRLASRHNELVDWLRTFDLVLDTRGGDSFTDSYGMSRLWTMSLMDEAVRRSRVPLILGPQTIGPFDTRRGRWLGRRTLRNSRLVMARDEQSFSVSHKFGRLPDLLTTDVAFAIGQPQVLQSRDVILNVSGLLWDTNPHVDPTTYRSVVHDLIETLLHDGRHVSLLAHVLDSPLPDNDVPVAKELAEFWGVEALIPTGLDDVRGMLASANVVVGARMHACLNALSVGRPAVAMAYSRKFKPLLAGLGWDHTVDLRDPVPHVQQVRSAMSNDRLESAVVVLRDRADERIANAVESLRHVV